MEPVRSGLVAGTVLNQYVIRRLMAAGGFSLIYLAEEEDSVLQPLPDPEHGFEDLETTFPAESESSAGLAWIDDEGAPREPESVPAPAQVLSADERFTVSVAYSNRYYDIHSETLDGVWSRLSSEDNPLFSPSSPEFTTM